MFEHQCSREMEEEETLYITTDCEDPDEQLEEDMDWMESAEEHMEWEYSTLPAASSLLTTAQLPVTPSYLLPILPQHCLAGTPSGAPLQLPNSPFAVSGGSPDLPDRYTVNCPSSASCNAVSSPAFRFRALFTCLCWNAASSLSSATSDTVSCAAGRSPALLSWDTVSSPNSASCDNIRSAARCSRVLLCWDALSS